MQKSRCVFSSPQWGWERGTLGKWAPCDGREDDRSGVPVAAAAWQQGLSEVLGELPPQKPRSARTYGHPRAGA